MFSSLLITLREGLEAALIIGIILGYLSKVKQKQLYKHIFIGAGLGVLASIVAAVLFNVLAGGFEGKAEQIFEGTVLLVAVTILSTMLLWMNKQSKSIGSDIQTKIDIAVGKGHIWGLISIAFLSVFREGIEIVLFMNAIAVNVSPGNSLAGGVIGLVIALTIAWFVFKSTAKLNLKKFFKITGIFMIFIAAGMLAGSIHEFEEAGIIPILIEHVWDINSILDENGTAGSFLKAVFGYNGNPSLIEVIIYLTYLVVTLKTFSTANSSIHQGGNRVV